MLKVEHYARIRLAQPPQQHPLDALAEVLRIAPPLSACSRTRDAFQASTRSETMI